MRRPASFCASLAARTMGYFYPALSLLYVCLCYHSSFPIETCGVYSKYDTLVISLFICPDLSRPLPFVGVLSDLFGLYLYKTSTSVQNVAKSIICCPLPVLYQRASFVIFNSSFNRKCNFEKQLLAFEDDGYPFNQKNSLWHRTPLEKALYHHRQTDCTQYLLFFFFDLVWRVIW